MITNHTLLICRDTTGCGDPRQAQADLDAFERNRLTTPRESWNPVAGMASWQPPTGRGDNAQYGRTKGAPK